MLKETILVVDDEKDILELLRVNLIKHDYNVLCAESGDEALDIINSESVKLTLLDIMMPVMDGYEVLSHIRKNLKNKNMPVIFLTALAEIEDKISGFEKGAVDYITKPFALPEVAARVKNHLNIKKSYEEEYKTTELCIRKKNDFLAQVSHEMRNPLNAIIGSTDLLMLKNEKKSKQYDYLSILSSASNSLKFLINDFLDFSKIEAGKFKINIVDFNLKTLIEELENMLALQANTKGLEFGSLINIDVPTLLKGDSNRLHQILFNITGNAVKFTKKGEVFIIVSMINETDTHAKLRFMIKDTGIGIPKNYFDRLFKPFSQTDSSIKSKYGLGLMISKQLIEMMGGEISVESQEEKGTTFYFTLTFEKQINKEEFFPQLPPDIKTKRILIIDDNYTYINIISNHLKSLCMSHEVAFNSKQALYLLRQAAENNNPFHIAMIDKTMPEIDGIELSQIIKEDLTLRETKIIIFVSLGLNDDIDNDKKIPDVFFLSKPIRSDDLFNCIIDSMQMIN